MATSYISRLGTSPEEAIKSPCLVATIESIALTGLPIINGIQVTEGARVLNLHGGVLQGIYNAKVGAWTRATDWNDAQDVVNGVEVLVTSPANTRYVATFTGDFEAGVTNPTFDVSTGNDTGNYMLKSNYDSNNDGKVDTAASADTVVGFDDKADLVGGKVPSAQLPAYVDDVLEFTNLAAFPLVGESGKIYVALDTSYTYRWGGTAYAELNGASGGVALGETSVTAYRGDRGKTAYDHSQTAHAPSNADNTSTNETSHANVLVDSDTASPVNASNKILTQSEAYTHPGEHPISFIVGLQTGLDTKADLVGGLVPSVQLPGYVDDVLEFINLASFPVTGEDGKIYVAEDVNKTYRWSGSAYVEIGSGGVALGETSSTAYRGDRGKAAYDHSQTAHFALNNTLTSILEDEALTAAQGKILKDLIDSLNFAISAVYNSGTKTVTVTNKDLSPHYWDLNTLINGAGKGINHQWEIVPSSTAITGLLTNPTYADGTSQTYTRIFPTSKIVIAISLEVKKTTTTNNFTNNNVVSYARAWARHNGIEHCVVNAYTKYGCSGRTSGTETWEDFFGGTTYITVGSGSGPITVDFGMANPTLTGLGTKTITSQIWSSNGSSKILFTEIET